MSWEMERQTLRGLPSRRPALVVIGVVASLICSNLTAAEAQTCPGWRDPAGKKIINGTPTTRAQWPSLAALRLTSPDRKQTLYVCGGTAIARDWVLTAAHCLDDIKKGGDGRYVSSSNWALDLLIGVDDVETARPEQTYAISALKLHPDYKVNAAVKHGADIALIGLARPFGGSLATLSLSGQSDPKHPPGAGLTVAGFGLTKGEPQGGTVATRPRADGGSVMAGSHKLLEVGLPLVPNAGCAVQWPNRMVGPGQMCAGYESGTLWRDSCTGDSGGPLVMFDTRGCPMQVGLVSWGHDSCGLAKAYGVYTRVSHHAGWLRREVAGLGAVAQPAAKPAELTAKEFMAQIESAVGAQRGEVRIAIRNSGPTVKLGGAFAFDVTSSVSGRLVLIDVNADGVATQIFPNEFVARGELGLISAGKALAVPGAGYGFPHFRAEPPLGPGRLVGLIVPRDFPVQSMVSAPARAKGFVPEPSTVGYLMNLIQQVSAQAAAQQPRTAGRAVPTFAIGSLAYEIVP